MRALGVWDEERGVLDYGGRLDDRGGPRRVRLDGADAGGPMTWDTVHDILVEAELRRQAQEARARGDVCPVCRGASRAGLLCGECAAAKRAPYRPVDYDEDRV